MGLSSGARRPASLTRRHHAVNERPRRQALRATRATSGPEPPRGPGAARRRAAQASRPARSEFELEADLEAAAEGALGIDLQRSAPVGGGGRVTENSQCVVIEDVLDVQEQLRVQLPENERLVGVQVDVQNRVVPLVVAARQDEVSPAGLRIGQVGCVAEQEAELREVEVVQGQELAYDAVR